MGVDLRRMEVRVIVVLPFTGQHPIDAIIDVGPHDQRILRSLFFLNCGFFFVQDIDQPALILDGRRVALLIGQRSSAYG